MSVGYEPCVISEKELQYPGHSSILPHELTEANNNTESMTMKPGSGNTRNAETRYRICGQCGSKSGVTMYVLPV
jgi:hypothetical protein